MANGERRKYYQAPICLDAVQTAECLTEGCHFRMDVGPDGLHGHDPKHEVVLLPADYTEHPLYKDDVDRSAALRDAHEVMKDRQTKAQGKK